MNIVNPSVRGRSRGLLTFLLLALYHSCFCLAAHPQTSAKPQATSMRLSDSEKEQSLAEACSVITKNLHVAILIQGYVPKSLKAPLPVAPDGPLEEQINAIAKTFDYRAERYGTVFALLKDNNNANNLPDMTISQCLHCLENIGTIVAPYNPHPTQKEISTGFGIQDLFSPEELATASASYLPISAIDDTERNVISRLLRGIYFHHTCDNIPRQIGFVETAPASLYFSWRFDKDLLDTVKKIAVKYPKMTLPSNVEEAAHEFGVQNIDAAGAGEFRPLTGLGALVSDGSISFQSSAPYVLVDSSLPSENGSDLKAPGLTLEKAIAELQIPDHSTRLSVDPSVSDLIVTIIGGQDAVPKDLMTAIAETYGLKLVADKSTHPTILKLTLPDTVSITSIEGVSDAITSALPATVRRAMHLVEARSAYDKIQIFRSPSDVDTSSVPKPVSNKDHSFSEETLTELHSEIDKKKIITQSTQTFKDFQSTQAFINEAPLKMRIEAVKELRFLAEPKIKLAKDGRVNLDELGPEGRNAYAALMLSYYLEKATQIISRPVPSYLTNFDQVEMKCGINAIPSGQRFFSAHFYVRQPDVGIVDQHVGVNVVLRKTPKPVVEKKE